jgi:hypothetical protein
LVRIGLLVVFLVFAATLHDHGTAYNDLHIVYLVVAIGLFAVSIALSRRRSGGPGRNGRGGGGPFGSGGGRIGNQDGSVGGGGSFGTPPPTAHPVEQPDPEAGP